MFVGVSGSDCRFGMHGSYRVYEGRLDVIIRLDISN
jgi:hypothetical protein